MNIINYLVKKKSMSQTAIAEKLGVSKSQITHWKKGAEIPHNRKEELGELAELFGWDTDWALHCENSEANEGKWYDYIKFLLKSLEEEVPIPDSVYDYEFFVPVLVKYLKEIEAYREPVPPEIVVDDDFDSLSLLIMDILRIYGPYTHWCQSVFDNLPDETFEIHSEIESHALVFALGELADELIKENSYNCEKLGSYKNNARNDIRAMIHILLRKLKKLRFPINHDYFEILDVEVYNFDDLAWGKNYDRGIIEYFTQAELMIYIEQKETNRLLSSLLEKIK